MKTATVFISAVLLVSPSAAALPPLRSSSVHLSSAFGGNIGYDVSGEKAGFEPISYGGAAPQSSLAGLVEPATTVSLFLGWYALNVYYNIVNKVSPCNVKGGGPTTRNVKATK